MEDIALEVSDLFSQYLHEGAQLELTTMLKRYETAFSVHRRLTFAESFYPTLYAPFEPVIDVARPETCELPLRIQENLSLQNAMRVQRPLSFQQRIKSSAGAGRSHRAEVIYTGEVFYEEAATSALPCTLKALRAPARAACSAEVPSSELAKTAYRYEEIIGPVMAIQAAFKGITEQRWYHDTVNAARILQGFCRTRVLSANFRAHFAEICAVASSKSYEHGALLFARISEEFRGRIRRCERFLRETFDFAPTRNQFFFPFEINNALQIYWGASHEQAIIQELAIDKNAPQAVKISSIATFRPEIRKDVALDLVVILSEPPDPNLEGYRNSQVCATLSVLALLTSEIVASLAVIAQADFASSYAEELLHIDKPYVVINARNGFQRDVLDFPAIDTIQLFNLNGCAQQSLRAFRNKLFMQRKAMSDATNYAHAAMLTSSHYCYEIANQALQCSKFTEITGLPILFMYESEKMQQQEMELMAIMTAGSTYYREIESLPQHAKGAVLARGTFLPSICDISHAGCDNYFLKLLKSEPEQPVEQRQESRERVLTVSGISSRLSSKRAAVRRNADSRQEIRIEIYNNGIIDGSELLDDQRTTLETDNPVSDDCAVDLLPFLPLKEVDMYSDEEASAMQTYIIDELEKQNATMRTPRDYRMLLVDLSKMKYKVMRETITSKVKEMTIAGKQETQILDFTSVDKFQPLVPDTQEQIVSEQIEKKVGQKLASTANLVVFIDASQDEVLVSYVLSAEDVCERKFTIPYRSHGWVFPARPAIYPQLKAASVPIINYLVSERLTGYATLSFIVGASIEPYDVHFGLNQLIFQFFAVERLANLRFDETSGALAPYCNIFEGPQKSTGHNVIALDLCHELLSRVDREQLRKLLYKYSYDAEQRAGFVYDVADDIFVMLIDRNSISSKIVKLRALLKDILRLIHAEFPDAETSVLSGAERGKSGSRDVEMSSNFLGIMRSLDELNME